MTRIDFTNIEYPKKMKCWVMPGYDRPINKIKFYSLELLSAKPVLLVLKKFSKVIDYIASFESDKKEFKLSLDELNQMNGPTKSDPEKFGYKGDVFLKEIGFIHKYAIQIRTKELQSESLELYEHLIQALGQVIEQKKITKVFNFGIGYPYIDLILAQKFPAVKFIGIERTPAAKIYYESFTETSSNLEVIHGDVIKHLKENRYEKGLFLHIRTAVLLPKDFLEELYEAVGESGFQFVYGAEQIGISRRTRKPYEFSLESKPSELYRRHMFIHNYPALLAKASYQVEEFITLNTRHPHEDYRILNFLAEKMSK